jgi:hypothetical protein
MSISDFLFGKPLASNEERAEHIGVAADRGDQYFVVSAGWTVQEARVFMEFVGKRR